jgi:Rnl2 family RNA ligase
MEFVKYNSIENTTNKELYKFRESNLYNPCGTWFVTEKVDGSNFGFFREEGTDNLYPAKHSCIIGDENFFNHKSIMNRYNKSILMMMDYIMSTNSNLSGVSIHGELCGGYYPETVKIPNTSRVQDRIHYSNNTEFIVFDIRIYDKDGGYKFLNHQGVVDLCNRYNIPVVPIIFTGTLDECLEWSTLHNADMSEIWKIFNMPNEIPGNIREGHVIKPATSMFLGMSRVIFKDKNNKFKENKSDKPKKEHVKYDYSEPFMSILEDIDDLICHNRFNSVVSKFGEYSIKDFGTLMINMVDDVIDQIQRDTDLYELLSNEDISELKKILIKKVSTFFVENKKELF